jgi:two-component system, cell cycle sensor histidine kinase and response regulator CckA
LGLATVYGIAGRVGGRVEIASEPGSGTTVSVYLPVSAESVEAGPPPREAVESPAGSRSILVVDNEDAVRTIVSRTLARHGYRVQTAGSGSEAEAVMAGPGEEVDLLLTDVLMPRMSGPELVERVRAGCPALRVIYMSGYPGDEASPLGPWGDGVTVLQKPFTGTQLVQAVGEALTLP